MGEFESLTAEDLETLHYLCDRHDHVGGRDSSGREPAVPEDEELPTSGLGEPRQWGTSGDEVYLPSASCCRRHFCN